jgi:hypothetical protein
MDNSSCYFSYYTQRHSSKPGNRSNVTRVVMLRAWAVTCRTSNKKKSRRDISVHLIRWWFTHSERLKKLLPFCDFYSIKVNVIANFRFCPTIAWIISVDMIVFHFPRDNFLAGFRSGRAARLTWLFIKFHVVSGDLV